MNNLLKLNPKLRAGFSSRIRIVGIACAATLVQLTAFSGQILLMETFNYTNGVIANEFAHSNPGHTNAIRSLIWEMTSGTLFSSWGAGWTGIPDNIEPNTNSSNGNNSSVFRLTTKKADFGDVAVSFALLNQGLSSTTSTPPVDWDGVHVFLRYQSESNLYYASVNRRDNKVVIKKKTPGGPAPSNGGTYSNLTSEISHTVPYNVWQMVTATVQNEQNGFVTIKLYGGNNLLVSAVDNGTILGAPITNPGKVGIRGDNANLKFENFTVTVLPSGSRPDTMAAITNLTAVAINPTTLRVEWPIFSSGNAHYFYATAFSVSSSSSSVPIRLTGFRFVAGGKVQSQISGLQPDTRYNIFNIFIYHSTDLATWSLASNVGVVQTPN